MSSPAPATPAPGASPRAPRVRLESVDLLRGLVIVLMAIDHTRDFFHWGVIHGYDAADLSRTTPALFFTRWITHFCAPVFSFLAGTGTCFSLTGGKTKPYLQGFLVSRGLWLIFLELTLFLWFGWQFEISWDTYKLGVLWSLGWSMIFLAAIIRLPTVAIGAIGVAMMVGHNAFDRVQPQDWGAWAWVWQLLHAGGTFTVAGRIQVVALYPLIPWLGVMALGYVFGFLYQRDAATRQRQLNLAGWGMIAAFAVLRFINVYGDPVKWTPQGSPLYTVMSFLDVTKYPPSLLYLLMTLGPACVLLSGFERWGTPAILRPCLVIGRVPMFFYLLHVPLIHGLAWICYTVQYGRADFFFGGSTPPAGAGFGLVVVYAVWLAVVIALYLPSPWYAELKKRRRDLWWLSYF